MFLIDHVGRARRCLLWLMICLFWVEFAPCLPSQSALAATSGAVSIPQEIAKSQIISSYGKLPVSFEANHGQTDAAVNFLARGSGYNIFLTPNRAVLSLSRSLPHFGPKSAQMSQSQPAAQMDSVDSVVSMNLLGANETAQPQGLEAQTGKSNYLIGNRSSQWHTHIPHYGKVKYSNIYPGIDLVYYGNQQQLEYDFVVAPGADPSAIRLQYLGADKLALNGAGDLVLSTPAGDVIEKMPVVYQEISGKHQAVSGTYRLLENNQVAFNLGEYNSTQPLIIDPVLVYSTYLKGNAEDVGYGIAVDKAGNAYITGTTKSPNFQTKDPLQASSGGLSDAFVVKLGPEGNHLIYATYLGGSAGDISYDMAVDQAENVYLVGSTNSLNFPRENPLQADLKGKIDGFVSKLDATGSHFVYSTYLGGSSVDQGASIALDRSGNVYITGTTFSTDFPTQNPIKKYNAGAADAFVSKLNPAGNSLVYSTYLGDKQNYRDQGVAIAVDDAGYAYVVGVTNGQNFPTLNAFQDHSGGGLDVFVSKLNLTGTSLVYSTYIGGNSNDISFNIAVDSGGSAYITGSTTSVNFPTRNPMQVLNGDDAFVTKFNRMGNDLVYSTYLGGNSGDVGYGIVVDSKGNAYIAGGTSSSDFPTQSPLQATLKGTADGFVSKLNETGTALIYSSYLGGDNDEHVNSIAVDDAGNAYVTGITKSTNFPTLNPLSSDKSEIKDASVFVSKIQIDTNVSSKDVSPQGVSSKDASPKDVSSKDLSAQDLSPKDAPPKDVLSKPATEGLSAQLKAPQ